MSTTTLVIGDVHNKIKIADKILKEENWDRAVFIGDYYDYFGDAPHDAYNVTKWLKETKNTYGESVCFLMGNHDVSYHDGKFRCAGWSFLKAHAIGNAMNDFGISSFLDLFELATIVKNKDREFLCTHAGIHEDLLGTKLNYYTLEQIASFLNDMKHNISMNSPYFQAGHARNGPNKIGGITWLDWNLEFNPIPDINQIVGHTAANSVRTNNTEDSINLNIDTHLKYYVLLSTDQADYEIKKVGK